MNIIKSRYSLPVFSALLISASCIFCSFDTKQQKQKEEVTQRATGTPQHVCTLEICDFLDFAGDSIPFTRHDIREKLDRELLAFTYMHSTTMLLVKRANQYFPVIEPILKEYGIPDDFKYLALIESYFNPRAVSPAKAAGIWQFMEDTGKSYGLEVNSEVDERYHLEKSTVAACKYLRDSYNVYRDWSIVAASYNGGRGRLSGELEKQKVTSYYDLYLNEETTRYVFRIIAAKEVISQPSKYGYHFKKEDFYHTVRTKTVEVNTAVEDWAAWAIENDTNYGQLKYFNPWIRGMKLTNKNLKKYKVLIPYAEDLDFDVDKVTIYDPTWLE